MLSQHHFSQSWVLPKLYGVWIECSITFLWNWDFMISDLLGIPNFGWKLSNIGFYKLHEKQSLVSSIFIRKEEVLVLFRAPKYQHLFIADASNTGFETITKPLKHRWSMLLLYYWFWDNIKSVEVDTICIIELHLQNLFFFFTQL